MSGFVLDASVALSWFLHGEVDPHADEVLANLATTRAAVPFMWFLEICNVLTALERRNRLQEAETGRILTLMRNLPVETDDTPVTEIVDRVMSLARRLEISSYDAAYLELAIRRGLPLATLDSRLAEAAKHAGVSIA